MVIAKVALDCPVDSLFDYRTTAAVEVGQLVVVTFGKRRQVGLVLEVSDQSAVADARLRDVESILPVEPLPLETLALIRFAGAYYHHPIGQAAFTALPAALRQVRYAAPKIQGQYALTDAGRRLSPDQFPTRAVIMRKLLAALAAAPLLTLADLRALSPRAVQLAESWIGEGWVRKDLASALELQKPSAPALSQHPLTDEQAEAVEAISAQFGRYAPWLLEGITGSGKTEVYFRLIERAQGLGSQTLLMVPEINLTPQLEQRFRDRFPAFRLVGLHSHLAQGERAENWLAARAGRADVVIGTRLSIFTPLPKLGLIIVDEEQDASFKQQDGLRYSARDLAVFCARQRRVPVVLGSATPSLETYHNALGKRFGHLHLSRRPAASRAEIKLIDMRGLQTQSLSAQAVEALGACHTRAEQSLVFLNRRGFAPVLVCKACGWNAGCPRCSARLVWHLNDGVIRCHYCGHEEPVPRACGSCGNQDLKGLGQGTQRLEQWLVERFAQARILRIDRDSTRRKHAWNAMQDAIRAERVDMLVGTQMLAKGHDFPKLTLVVVVDPDGALFSADFRAGEKLFQQLMQVAGRAGRADLPGEVLVQTQFPDHPLYQALVRQDYRSFAQALLEERKLAGFPPYVYQALLRAESQHEAALMDFLAYAAAQGVALTGSVTLFDPVPATMSKVAGHHRAHLLAQSGSRAQLQRFLARWRPVLTAKNARRVRWSIDVDPMEL